MGSLAVPGPKTGSKGAPRPPQERRIPSFWDWFPSFLKDELRPYPGRSLLALRYVLAATLTMLVIVTFRLPGAAVGGFYSLLLPRDSPHATAKSAVALLAAFASSFGLVVIGTMLFIDYPLTHFLWVIGSFFLGFAALSVMTNYAAASAFTIMIVLAVPAWDAPLPTAAIVASNLWVAGSVAVAIAATLVVESVSALFETTAQLDTGLEDRLSAVEQYLQQRCTGNVSETCEEKVQQLATVGVSRLRALALKAGTKAGEVARQSTAVSLVGRIVDLAATLGPVEHFHADEIPRVSALARQMKEIQDLLKGNRGDAVEASTLATEDERPILLELERTAELLRLTLSQIEGHPVTADLEQPADPPFLVPDALTNLDHLRFALRGCLALVICYVVMNAVAWPGLSTSLFTVVVTALSSIGSSRQKQLLRVSGAMVGGVILGMGSQVLVLPMLDGIGGFLIMFVSVTWVAAWFITASPRISYFGTQMALAFFLIHLRGPYAQTNLAIARDNIMGILLGLIVMWLVFDSLGSKPAAVVMRELFAKNLKLMAQLATPWPNNQKTDLRAMRALRDKISQNFSAVNSQADGVLFELGRSRAASLRTRNLLLSWQPRMRGIFLFQIALLQYRAPVSPAELSQDVLTAQVRFDVQVKFIFENMAEAFGGVARSRNTASLSAEFDGLKAAIDRTYGGHPNPRAAAIVSLSSHLANSATALQGEIQRFRKLTCLNR